MKLFSKYLALTVAFIFLSSGVVINAFRDQYAVYGDAIMWILVPSTMLFLIAVTLNEIVGVRMILLRGRIGVYCAFAFTLAYLNTLFLIFGEYLLREHIGAPHRVSDYLSPWILLDTLSNCMLQFLVLAGIGMCKLYGKWREETRREEEMNMQICEYISEVRQRLKPELILDSFDDIIASLRISSGRAIEKINGLCDWLRHQLYELPEPEKMVSGERNDDLGMVHDQVKEEKLLLSGRYGVMRNLLLQVVLALICLSVFFDAPDHFVFDASRAVAFVTMMGLLDICAYVNLKWLYPRMRVHKSLKRYSLEVFLFTMAMLVPLVVGQIMTYEPNVYETQLSYPLMLMSTAGSLTAIFFFLGGIAAVCMLRDWLSGRRRMVLLNAESLRQEYAYLRKQINPHFLFNVLNNASILAFEDSEDAIRMFEALKHMLEYQFAETGKTDMTLEREMDFLDTYLSLEASRIDSLEYELSAQGDTKDVRIPTMIYITFVENAVKYSTMTSGGRKVTVRFEISEPGVAFRCENTFDASRCKNGRKTEDKAGGLGIANTRRRLQLIYNDRFELTQCAEDNKYIVKLLIPNELHNSGR